MRTKIVLVFITLLSLNQAFLTNSLFSSSESCSGNCIECKDSGCKKCFNSKREGEGCNEKLSPDDKCLIYKYQGGNRGNECELCMKGWALNNLSNRCESYHDTYEGKCKVAQKFTGDFTVCLACINGYPSNSYTDCIDFNGAEVGKNCYLGVLINGEVKCYSCEHGYAFNPKSKVCESTSIKGCAQFYGNEDFVDKEKCEKCHFGIEGKTNYFQRKVDYKCYV